MKPTKVISRIIDVLILSVIAMYLISAGFRDSRTSGWYQQWFPNLNGSTIRDITFLDSLTGFAVTSSNSLLQQYILKTTNGGDNWSINYTFNTPNSNWYFFRVIKVDLNTVYAFSWNEMFKTTDRGNNWAVNTYAIVSSDFAIVNKDTLFSASESNLSGGVYRSTNGGLNWQRIWTLGVTSGNPNRIYMYNASTGFCCLGNSITDFRKTTNGGYNWISINDNGFIDIKFADSLTGYKVNADLDPYVKNVKKTTDGGITWVAQNVPTELDTYGGISLSVFNTDSVFYVGPTVLENGFYYGVLVKTTNGGVNWEYVIPDTSIRLDNYHKVIFINENNGWAFKKGQQGQQPPVGIHTKTGGQVGINQTGKEVPNEFELFQNYPNPFNQLSIIQFKVSSSKFVKLVVYDISGKEVRTLVNGKYQPGTYQVSFNAEGLSSGVYFYSMKTNGFISTKKCVLIK